MITDVSELHPSNALVPIAVKLSGKTTDVSELQSRNA